jgi:hypothetical protein
VLTAAAARATFAVAQIAHAGARFNFNLRNLGPAPARGVELWLRDPDGQNVSTRDGGPHYAVAVGEVVEMRVDVQVKLELERLVVWVAYIDAHDEQHETSLDTPLSKSSGSSSISPSKRGRCRGCTLPRADDGEARRAAPSSPRTRRRTRPRPESAAPRGCPETGASPRRRS